MCLAWFYLVLSYHPRLPLFYWNLHTATSSVCNQPNSHHGTIQHVQHALDPRAPSTGLARCTTDRRLVRSQCELHACHHRCSHHPGARCRLRSTEGVQPPSMMRRMPQDRVRAYCPALPPRSEVMTVVFHPDRIPHSLNPSLRCFRYTGSP